MKKISGLCLLLLLVFACENESDTTFTITRDQVGRVTKKTTFAELDQVFSQDSIVKGAAADALGIAPGKIEVFEKGGNHLLSITPTNDSIPLIEHIRIHDPRYKTTEGITIQSTFKDIKDRFTIKKVLTSMKNVVVLIKDHDLYFTISKEELPAELRFGSNEIDAVQIPDQAKIKYMMVGWN